MQFVNLKLSLKAGESTSAVPWPLLVRVAVAAVSLRNKCIIGHVCMVPWCSVSDMQLVSTWHNPTLPHWYHPDFNIRNRLSVQFPDKR